MEAAADVTIAEINVNVEIPLEPRPHENSPEVLQTFYENLAETLIEDSDMAAGMNIEEIVAGLRYAGPPRYDGFEYAKHLEANGWSEISANDVELLDTAFHEMTAAVAAAEARWVERNDIRPTFESGAPVRTTIHMHDASSRRMIPREVAGRAYFDDRLARVGKCLFRDHEWIERTGDQGGYLVDFEDLEVI